MEELMYDTIIFTVQYILHKCLMVYKLQPKVCSKSESFHPINGSATALSSVIRDQKAIAPSIAAILLSPKITMTEPFKTRCDLLRLFYLIIDSHNPQSHSLHWTPPDAHLLNLTKFSQTSSKNAAVRMYCLIRLERQTTPLLKTHKTRFETT